MALFGHEHPGLDADGCGAWQHHRGGQTDRVGFDHACQLVQGQLLDAQIVLGGDFLGSNQIETGLGLALVGDGAGADLEVSLGGRQLLGGGGFLGADKGQGVLAGQHIKIGLADADHQILLSREQLGLRQLDDLAPLFQAGVIGRAIKRVAAADGGALRGGGAAHDRIVVVHQTACRRGAEVHRGIAHGFGLRCPRQIGLVREFGRLQCWIDRARRFVQGQQ